MKILALEHELPHATVEQFQRHAKAEARQVWDLYQEGIIRELYFHADRNDAVVVMECASVSEAQEILSALPFVQNKLITFEIIPLRAYSGFGRLFTED
ncbi:MAG: superoxide dismutase [Anaerolineales bacterium]|nr:superoxide dismutase [Anaerolineales bacterium]